MNVLTWRIAAIAVGLLTLIVYIVLSGKWVTTNASWYLELNAPTWQPPNWVFGVIWPYNFIVLGIAAVVIALNASAPLAWSFCAFFAASVFFAVLWAYRFYVDHALTSAAICLTLAALFTLPVLFTAFATARWLGWLLIPYQIWVILATSLSWGYASLNS